MSHPTIRGKREYKVPKTKKRQKKRKRNLPSHETELVGYDVFHNRLVGPSSNCYTVVFARLFPKQDPICRGSVEQAEARELPESLLVWRIIR
jgi:hypothetical protein